MVWPERIINRFRSVVDPSVEAAFHGPYNKLLVHLFPEDDEQDWTVEPQFNIPGTRQAVDFAVTFQVLLDSRPVFLVELKPPGNLRLLSKRAEADSQICGRLGDILPFNNMPRVHGVSAFGTKLCFYTIDRATHQISPTPIQPNHLVVTDTAPEARWNCDILEQNGETKLREVVAEIKAWCAANP